MFNIEQWLSKEILFFLHTSIFMILCSVMGTIVTFHEYMVSIFLLWFISSTVRVNLVWYYMYTVLQIYSYSEWEELCKDTSTLWLMIYYLLLYFFFIVVCSIQLNRKYSCVCNTGWSQRYMVINICPWFSIFCMSGIIIYIFVNGFESWLIIT